MKRIVILFMTALVLVSCSTVEDKLQLTRECQNLMERNDKLRSEMKTLQANVTSLYQEKTALMSNKEPKYIVKFEIKQGTFTLDIGEHIKNQINAIEVEIPVSKDFYYSLSLNQDLTDNFKYGSLIFNGDFSKLHMRVINKRIE